MQTQTTTERPTTAPSFSFNHPKNYFGVPIAAAADGATGPIIEGYIVRATGAAKEGAIELGLIDESGTPTESGDAVIDAAVTEYGNLETALEQFGEWRGTTTRFTELGGGVFSDVTQDVMAEHPAVQAITEILSEQDVSPVTLPEIVHEFYARDSDAATALFIRNGVSLPDDASERANRLFDPEVYQAQFAFQFKTMLYHAGILTESGSDSTHLAPQTDMWELEPDFGGDL